MYVKARGTHEEEVILLQVITELFLAERSISDSLDKVMSGVVVPGLLDLGVLFQKVQEVSTISEINMIPKNRYSLDSRCERNLVVAVEVINWSTPLSKPRGRFDRPGNVLTRLLDSIDRSEPLGKIASNS